MIGPDGNSTVQVQYVSYSALSTASHAGSPPPPPQLSTLAFDDSNVTSGENPAAYPDTDLRWLLPFMLFMLSILAIAMVS
jgi:hypothetical protein